MEAHIQKVVRMMDWGALKAYLSEGSRNGYTQRLSAFVVELMRSSMLCIYRKNEEKIAKRDTFAAALVAELKDRGQSGLANELKG
jgi:hypothetical protein